MENSRLDVISKTILNSAFEVHKQLRPGLLESVYEICLFKELTEEGLDVKRQVPIPVIYKNKRVELDFRIDLLVEDEIILELKAVEELLPVHDAQILTYLRLADKRLGFLINFNVPLLKQGFKRKVNNF